MKELSIEQKAKAYDEAFERASNIHKDAVEMKNSMIIKNCEVIFPKLKESEDEGIREKLIKLLRNLFNNYSYFIKDPFYTECIAWLEKQSDTKETINMYEFAQGVLRGAAINLITWIDYNAAEGNMCLSNIECKDIEDALVNSDWGKIYDYIKKKLEKQGEHHKFLDTIQVGDHVTRNEDGVLVNLSQLNRVAANAVESEKQDEHKPTDKIEPRFKIGDWIVDKSGLVQQVLDFRGGIYTCTYNSFTTDCESNYHLWTIQDAKDGDVLVGKIDGDSYVLIYKQIKDGWIETYGHYYNTVDRFCVPSQLFCRDCKGTFYPATKEQRDLLFQKMKEAGYEWDAEKKELKKIEQNPAWSEEDEEILNQVIEDIVKLAGPHVCYHKDVDWLKSLKGRVLPQPRQEWSEEDENRFDNLIFLVEHSDENKATKKGFIEFINKLKSLRPQPQWKPSDAIEYNRNTILSELEKIVKDKEEAGNNYVFAFSEVKELIERIRHENNSVDSI